MNKHKVNALYALSIASLFVITGFGLLIYGVSTGNDQVIPEIFAAIVFAFVSVGYGSRETIRYRKEIKDERQSQAATKWPPEKGSSPDDR